VRPRLVSGSGIALLAAILKQSGNLSGGGSRKYYDVMQYKWAWPAQCSKL